MRLLPLLLTATAAAQSEQCPASGGGAGCERRHPWPYARGPRGSYGLAPAGSAPPPKDLNRSLAWSWTDARGRAGAVLNGGPVIDDELNVYHAATNGLYKLSPEGKTLWSRPGDYSAAPVLVGDALYGSDKRGAFFALDLATGQPLWQKRPTRQVGSDCHSVTVHDGIVLGPGQGFEGGGQTRLFALNASTGQTLWTYDTDAWLWNVMPMFTDNGTVLFQDMAGGAYHMEVRTGKLLWRSGVLVAEKTESWTDGMSWLGPNGLFYVVHVNAPMGGCTWSTTSDLRAYRVADGSLAWRADFPYAANSQPVAGRLKNGRSALSVVMPVGTQAGWPVILTFVVGLGHGFCMYGPIALALLWLLALLGSKCRPRRCCRRKRRTLLAGVLALPGSAIVAGALYALHYASSTNSRWPSELRVLDAATGELQWRHEFPVYEGHSVAGDAELFWRRSQLGVQAVCVPNGWGSPSVDSSGAIWMGHQNGRIYRLADEDGDGKVGEGEVASFDMEASSTHFGGAWAPGLLVWASCDTVFAFKWDAGAA